MGRQPYSLRKKEITEDLKNDFQFFFNFKTDLMVSPLERNETWTLKPAGRFSSCHEWEREFCSTKANDLGETQCAPTGKKRFELYRRFFGALKKQVDQDGNHPYDPKNFRFVWLAEKKLVNIAIDFFHNRMGQYTMTAKELIKFSVGLLLPKVGYVRQHPEFGLQLPTPVVVLLPPPHQDGQDEPKSAWERWCDDQLKELKLLLEGLTKRHDIKRARDPKVPIKEYLDRVQPISALFDLSRNMREYLDTHPLLRANWAVVLERDYLLARLITVQPLRINMFKIMTHRKDNSGNLYRRVDGTWAIRFQPEDFKNLDGAAGDSEEPYDVPLSDESIGRDIERFIDQIRSEFKDDSDKVFVAYNMGHKVKGRLNATLSAAFTARTQQFLKDSMGFGPHAVRHIVVTDFLRHNPGKYQVAADMLHDKVATVIANYAHLAAADGHKFYQEYLAGMQPGLVEKQSFGTPELMQAILANLNKNKSSIPAELRALLNELTNPAGKAGR